MTRAFPGWMVRNVEKEKLGHGMTPCYQAVIPRRPSSARARPRQRLAEGRSFVYHLAEGIDPELREEFADLTATPVRASRTRRHPLDGPRRRGVRALEPTCGGTIVWSPFSNLWLYGEHDRRARRSAPRAAGCASASDWAPSGTRNLLGELKVAALWNERGLEGALDDRRTWSRW